MRLRKAKNVSSTQRKENEDRELLGMTAEDDAVVLLHNNQILGSIENGGHTIEQVDRLRSSLYCSQCKHTLYAHKPHASNPHHAWCVVCSCSKLRESILRMAQQQYETWKRTASAPLKPPKSAHHDKNKRVLQAERRNPGGNAEALYTCTLCHHDATFHKVRLIRGVVVGHYCDRNNGSCGCPRSRQDVVLAGRADAES